MSLLCASDRAILDILCERYFLEDRSVFLHERDKSVAVSSDWDPLALLGGFLFLDEHFAGALAETNASLGAADNKDSFLFVMVLGKESGEARIVSFFEMSNGPLQFFERLEDNNRGDSRVVGRCDIR